MNKAIDYIKFFFSALGFLLLIAVFGGLYLPYLLGSDPLPANAEPKYRRRGWIVFAIGYLINAALMIAMFYDQEGGIIAGALFSLFLCWFAWLCGRGEYSSKMEFGDGN